MHEQMSAGSFKNAIKNNSAKFFFLYILSNFIPSETEILSIDMCRRRKKIVFQKVV